MTALPRVGCFYTVTPGLGEQGTEWFPDTLAGLAGKQGALARAMHASAGGVIQQVTVTRGRVATVIRTYQHGKPVTPHWPGADSSM